MKKLLETMGKVFAGLITFFASVVTDFEWDLSGEKIIGVIGAIMSFGCVTTMLLAETWLSAVVSFAGAIVTGLMSVKFFTISVQVDSGLQSIEQQRIASKDPEQTPVGFKVD